MPLYKFVKESEKENHSVLQSCIEGNIMFSRIPDLNDPSEMFTSVDDDEMEKSLNRILDEGCFDNELVNLQKHINLMSKIFPENEAAYHQSAMNLSLLKVFPREIIISLIRQLPTLLQKTNDLIQKRIGIFCVSETFDSYPMWSHYADQARGFVVEYVGLEQKFEGDATGVFDVFKPINYCDKCRSKVSFSPSSLNELFFSKLKDWEYEHEIRLVKLLADCRTEKTENHTRYFAKEKYPEKISRIIVGWNNSPVQLEEIRNCVKQYCSISVVQAVPNGDHIQIKQFT